MLSVIVPTYNEEGAVEDIIRRIDAALQNENFEILVIDDGSTDATPAMLKRIELSSLRTFRLPINLGNGASIMKGVHEAKGKWIATIDADDTYHPEDIPRLYENIRAEDADMIVGLRQGLQEGRSIHSFARNLLRRLAEIFSDQSIDDVNSGLRIVRRELIMKFEHFYPQRFSLHICLTVLAGRDNAKILYEPIRYGPRIGVSKLSPGLRGPWNFLKFLLLIPWVSLRRKRTQNMPDLGQSSLTKTL